jgi:hypothetical protein
MPSRDDPAPFTVRAADQSDVAMVLSVLSGGYGRDFGADWFHWKHRECPWGESRVWLAEDAGGALGVVFGLPWPLRSRATPVPAWRLVDGATTPRAQRRGVFRAVVAAELVAAATPPGIVLATATPEAGAAHAKNGAVLLPHVLAFDVPVRWQPAELTSGDSVLDSWQPPDGDALHTAWTAEALRWRLDPRSGFEYEVSSLAAPTSPHGVVHRLVSRRGIRSVVVTAQWGSSRDVARVLRALAWKAKAVSVVMHAGAGTPARRPRIARRSGRSLFCVWDLREAGSPPVAGSGRIEGWALDGLALEGVV